MVMKTFIEKVEAIAPCGSTGINENLNHMVATEAPKCRHYSTSGCLKTRVSSVVAKKNEGHGYLYDVYTSGEISPGEFYSKHAKSIDRT